MEWLAVWLPGMLAARLELYSRELKIKVLVKKLKRLDQGLKSAANLLQGAWDQGSCEEKTSAVEDWNLLQIYYRA
jgi:hypothetical protein